MRKSFNAAKYQNGGELNTEKRCLWGCLGQPLELLVDTFSFFHFKDQNNYQFPSFKF